MRWIPPALGNGAVARSIVITGPTVAETPIYLKEPKNGRAHVVHAVFVHRGRRIEEQIERIVIGTKYIHDRDDCWAKRIDSNIVDGLSTLVGTRVRGVIEHYHHADFISNGLQRESETEKDTRIAM